MTDSPRPTAESPETEAGRKLLDQGAPLGSTREWFAQDILAIEAEAAALSESALRDLYRLAVQEHGHDEKAHAPWPSCLPAHIAMGRAAAILAALTKP